MQEFRVVSKKGVEIFKCRAKAFIAASLEEASAVVTYLPETGWLYYLVNGKTTVADLPSPEAS